MTRLMRSATWKLFGLASHKRRPSVRKATWKLSMRRWMRWWGQRRRMSFNAMHAPQSSALAEVGRGGVCTRTQVWPPGRKFLAAAACPTFSDEPSEYTHTVSASEACVRAAAAVQFQLQRSTSLSEWATGAGKGNHGSWCLEERHRAGGRGRQE